MFFVNACGAKKLVKWRLYSDLRESSENQFGRPKKLSTKFLETFFNIVLTLGTLCNYPVFRITRRGLIHGVGEDQYMSL